MVGAAVVVTAGDVSSVSASVLGRIVVVCEVCCKEVLLVGLVVSDKVASDDSAAARNTSVMSSSFTFPYSVKAETASCVSAGSSPSHPTSL